MERHRSARAHLAVELDRAAALCSSQHNLLPAQLDRLLAMLLLARDEILWLFQHLDEVIILIIIIIIIIIIIMTSFQSRD
jgi:hypothetical protein